MSLLCQFPLLKSSISVFLSVCLPFLLRVWGLRITVLSTLAEFLLAVGMPGTLGELGRAQRPHLTYPLMCLRVSDGGRERERECVYIREKRKRETVRKKEKEREAYGWKDRKRVMQTGTCETKEGCTAK